MIGEEITVTVLGVKGNEVKLAFWAPKKVPIHREEVYDRICREKMEWAGVKPGVTTVGQHIEGLRRSLQTES
jgi:carbon storage regulator